MDYLWELFKMLCLGAFCYRLWEFLGVFVVALKQEFVKEQKKKID